MASRKSIYPPSIRFFRLIFPVLEAVAPPLATNLAVRLFLTPVRFGFSDDEKKALETYDIHSLFVNGKKVVYYTVGEGPEIIMLHGWSGRGTQFRVLARHLVEAGFRCIIIDAPGHGKSEGGRTNLFEFSQAFREVLSKHDDVKAVIGHSLGAATISYAISEGVKVFAFISIAAPVIAQDILDSFTQTINASRKVQKGIRKKAVEHFGRTFQGVTMESTFKKSQCAALAIHGDQDKDVPLSHLEYLKKIRPEIDAQVFEGVGHRRILKDPQAIHAIINWTKKLD